MTETLDIVPVQKPNNIKELGSVNVDQLKALVSRVSEEVWDQEDARKENDFGVFHHTRHIVFRFTPGNRDHRTFYSNPIWNVWQGMLMPIMNKMIEPYRFTNPIFPKVMLARLEAGQVIDMHVDGEGSNLHAHKIHVALQTNEKALFHIDDETFHLAEGVGYEVNNIKRHGVENHGVDDRIHLIFEVYDELTNP